jgi:hypothetical protein
VTGRAWIFLALVPLAGFWLFQARQAWRKKATWDRVGMKWVKSRKGSRDYCFDFGFNLIMGAVILVAAVIFSLGYGRL